MKYSDLGKYIREVMKEIASEEDRRVFDEKLNYSNNMVYADINRLALLTNGEIYADDELVNPLSLLTGGM